MTKIRNSKGQFMKGCKRFDMLGNKNGFKKGQTPWNKGIKMPMISGKNNVLYRHGMYGTKFYIKWYGIKNRCLNKNYSQYCYYGGRGITICKEWLSFQIFYNDMYQAYQRHVRAYGENQTTIDRIDNNKGYYKKNCRWTTPSQNSFNKRNNHLITFNGKTMPLTKWSKKMNLTRQSIEHRINRGWSIEKSLMTPINN